MKFYDRRIERWVSLSFDKCVRQGEMSVLVLHSLPKSGLNPVGLLHAKQYAKPWIKNIFKNLLKVAFSSIALSSIKLNKTNKTLRGIKKHKVHLSTPICDEFTKPVSSVSLANAAVFLLFYPSTFFQHDMYVSTVLCLHDTRQQTQFWHNNLNSPCKKPLLESNLYFYSNL